MMIRMCGKYGNQTWDIPGIDEGNMTPEVREKLEKTLASFQELFVNALTGPLIANAMLDLLLASLEQARRDQTTRVVHVLRSLGT